ncbi:MAG: tannase/feruloyl esterase family alpha/beta hydrolase [Acidobacteriota bacterium]
MKSALLAVVTPFALAAVAIATQQRADATTSAPPEAAASCERLAGLTLADTSVTSAGLVTENTFRSPDAAATVAPMRAPAFCRVAATTKPAVRFEVWMPAQSWNGKFQGVGNGGTAGVIPYAAMATALNRGYAVVGTDTGHVNARGFDSTWALNRPDLVADFGHRGLHVSTVNGKAIARAFYEKDPAHSYYVGCSKGGQQGLMEAQRYPDDYDGLIAGDPANNWTRFYAGGHLWYSIATMKDAESYIPAGKVSILANAVNQACDATDGVRDGVLNDPRTCKFNPAVLTCKPGDDPATCYTPKQTKAIQDIWAGAKTSSGELIYPGLAPGGEAGSGGWASWTTGTAPFTGSHWLAAEGFFKYMVFNDPSWDFRAFNYDTDVRKSLDVVAAAVDATNANLRPLRDRGSKLIVYHGWSDPDISPFNSISYYEDVVKTMNGAAPRETALADTQSFFRLFMVPGMQHCSGGPGAASFDMLSALERWVEQGTAPEQVVATHLTNGVADRTRPLCVYPKVAQYVGTGSTDEAANFVCRVP